jgi:hypothetical protein
MLKNISPFESNVFSKGLWFSMKIGKSSNKNRGYLKMFINIEK